MYSNIGFKENQLKRFESALIHLTKAIELDPQNAYAFNNRALVNLNLSNFDEARNDIISSVELNPNNPYVYKHSAMIYLELKDFESACTELTKAKELGYAEFGNESDLNEVDQFLKVYCNQIP